MLHFVRLESKACSHHSYGSQEKWVTITWSVYIALIRIAKFVNSSAYKVEKLGDEGEGGMEGVGVGGGTGGVGVQM